MTALTFQKQQTPSGVSFGMLKGLVAAPAPLLLLLASSADETLSNEPYCHGRVGRLLHAQGWNVISLDLPCHGADRRAGEPEELAGWAARIRQGEDIVAAFQKRVNDVLRHLIATGIADPARIAAAGTSRGGFMAFQAAIGNPCFCAVAAFAPVTDLIALAEFAGQADNPLVQRLALMNAVETLADRAAWIIIGNADDRVDTGKAVTFANALMTTSRKLNLGCEITLRLMATSGHASFPEWHDEAAKWFLQTVVSTVRILPAPGHSLAVPCRSFPPEAMGNKHGLVIHLYGHGGSHTFYNLMRPAFAQLRRRLREAGYWVIVPDLGPSHFMNPRSAAILDDVIAMLIKRGEIDPKRVHLLGCSMGGTSALIYASLRPNTLRSVCAVFPMTDLAQVPTEAPAYLECITEAHGIAAADPTPALQALSPIRHIDAFAKTPVFLLHGDADALVPVHHSRDFAAALRAAGYPVVYKEVPGGGHDDIVAMDWQEAIFQFILKDNTATA